MATILATVDIEDLATAKIGGIKDALTDLASTQQQVAAQSAALGAQMQGAIAAMGSQAASTLHLTESYVALTAQMQQTVAQMGTMVTTAQQATATVAPLAAQMQQGVAAMSATATATQQATGSFQNLVAQVMAATPAVQQTGTAIQNLAAVMEAQKATTAAAADILRLYAGGLAMVGQAAKDGVLPIQLQAQALAEILDAAKAGVVGLREHTSTLQGMVDQLAKGIPLTKEQAAALETMAVSMAEANRATLSNVSATQLLGENQRLATAAIREHYSALTLLTTQMREGTTVTGLQADALRELAEAAQDGQGFTKEQAASLQELANAVQAGQVLTKEQAATLATLTKAYGDTNAAVLGLKAAEEEELTAVQRLITAHQAAEQVIRQNYQALQILTTQMQVGTKVTQLQADALAELAARAKEGQGFTKEHADRLRDLALALQTGVTLTKAQSLELQRLSASYLQANKAALGFKDANEQNLGAMQQFNLAMAAVSAGLALVGANMLGLLKESAVLAAKAETGTIVMSQVAKNAGESALEMRVQAEAIKRLGITSAEAGESVVKFVQANLKLADASKIARVAQDLAVVAGINSSQAYERLTHAIQAQSAMALRSFGIVTGLEKIYSSYAQTIGKTGRELSEVEKKQAFVNRILEEGEKVAGTYEAAMGTAGKQMTSFARFVEEAKTALGNALLPTMGLAISVATEFLKFWIALPAPIQAFITAIAAAATAMSLFAAAASGMKALKLTELIVSWATALMRVLVPSMVAATAATEGATVALTGFQIAAGGITLVLGLLAAGYVLLSNSQENLAGKQADQLAAMEAEDRAFESAIKKYYEATTALDTYTKQRDMLTAQFAEATDQAGEYEMALRNVEAEQSKLNAARATMIRLHPELATALTGEVSTLGDLAVAINTVTEKRKQDILQVKLAYLASFDALKQEEAAARAKEEAARKALAAAERSRTATRGASLGPTGITPMVKTAEQLAAELRPLQEAVTEASRELVTAAGRVEAQAPVAEQIRRSMLSAVEQQTLMQVDMQVALNEWKEGNTKWAEQLRVAGSKFTEASLLKSRDVSELRARLREVDDAWAKHTAEMDKQAKQEKTARESVRKLGAPDRIELAKYDELNKMLGAVAGNTTKWSKTVELAKSLLEQYGRSAEVNTGRFKQLDAALKAMTLDKYLGLPPETVREYDRLQIALKAAKDDTELYARVLEDATGKIDEFTRMTRQQKAALGDTTELLEAAARKTMEFAAAQADAVAKQNATELGAFTRESIAATTAAVQQAQQAQTDAALATRTTIREVNADIAQSYRAMNADIAAEQLSGYRLREFQLQQEIEEVQRRFEMEKDARARGIEDERRAVRERINLLHIEAVARAEAAVKQRKLQIEEAQREAQYLRDAAARTKNQRIAQEAELQQIRADAMADGLDAYKRGINEQLGMDLQRLQAVRQILDQTVDAHEAANDQINDSYAQLTKDQIARQQQMLRQLQDGTLLLRDVWRTVVDAAVSGFSQMLQGAKTWKEAVAGIWQSLKNVVFGVLEAILKQWLLNLIKMKVAAKAADLAGSVADMPGEAGGGGAAAPPRVGLPRGGLFPANPTGTQIAAGGVMGGVVGATVGYGVGQQTGSRAGGALAGAASGAAVGGMYGGVPGAIIGGGIGFFAGLFGGSQAQKDAKKARDEYVKSWSGGLEELKQKATEVGEQLAFEKMLRANTPEKVAEQIEKIEKALALKEAKESLATTEDQLVALSKQAQLVGYDLTKLYNAKTIEEFNREQEKLNKLLEEQQQRIQALTGAAQGLETWATGFQNTIGKGFQKAFPDPKAAEAFMKQYQEAVDKGFRGTFVEFAKHARLSDTVIANLEKVGAAAQDEFQSLGITAAATFAGIIRETGDITQAMNAIAPTLDKLIDAQDQWGLTADDTFASLLQFRRIIKDNEDIFQSLGGMTQALKGLSEAGALTEETFDALGRTAVEKFNTLVERTGDQRMALMSMQPTLQALWEAQKKYGFSVDESTQALIDQGVEQGIVGASMQGVNQRMLDVLGLIAQQLGVARDKLEAIGVTGDHAVDRVTDRLGEAGDAAEEAGQHFARSREEYNNLADVARRGLPPPDPEAERRYNEFRMTAKETADQLRDTGDQGRTSGDAVEGGAEAATRGLDQIVWKARQAEDALWRMGEAGQQAGYQIEMSSSWAANGRSPTGIKEITLRLKESEKAMKDFSEYFVTQAQKVEDAATDIAGQHRVDLSMVDPATLGLQKVDPAVPPQTGGQSVTVQVTQEGPQISVNAIDNANMEEAWRSKIMPEYLKHIDNNADQLAERTEAAISRHRRRAS